MRKKVQRGSGGKSFETRAEEGKARLGVLTQPGRERGTPLSCPVGKALAESEELYRNLFDNSLDAILITNPEGQGRVIAANAQACGTLGWPPDELIGSIRDATLTTKERRTVRMLKERARKGHFRGEVTFKRKDGSVFPAEVATSLLKNSCGEVRAAFIIRDVSERRQMEKELREARDEQEGRVRERTVELEESRQRFRDLAELLPQMVFEADVTGRFTYANRSALEMFGYTIGDLEKGIHNTDVVAPSERARVLENGARILRGEVRKGAEYVGRRKDGSEFPIFIRAVAIEKQGEKVGFRGVVNDLTESRKAEEELRRLAVAVDAVAEGVGILATDGTILYVNSGYLKMTGYERQDLVGRNVDRFRNDFHPERFYEMLSKSVLSGAKWAGRVVLARKDGSFFENDITVSPIRDRSENIINYAIVARDVTEKLRLEEQLRQAQKMEALGTLTGGIAHDFNNILAAIIGHAELEQDRMLCDAEGRESLQRIIEAGLRARDLIKQMLTFSRRVEQKKQPVILTNILKESASLMRASIPTTIEIRFETRSKEDRVLGDPVQLQQVLMNLCTNAAHAMRDTGGILTIALGSVDLSGAAGVADPDLKPGRYVELSVRDTGHGMAKEVMERIFDPFFTTKQPGEGTGLGLSVVHGIVKGHGGAITVESRVGEGSTFNVYLPLFSTEGAEEDEARQEVPLGKGNVLLIDDEDDVLEVGRRLLEGLGYTVTTSRSSVEAISLFARSPYGYDAVVTDQTMPGVTGVQLADVLLAMRRDIPIVLVTGFSHAVDAETAMAMGIKAFLMKPLTRGELARALKDAMGSSPDENV